MKTHFLKQERKHKKYLKVQCGRCRFSPLLYSLCVMPSHVIWLLLSLLYHTEKIKENRKSTF